MVGGNVCVGVEDDVDVGVAVGITLNNLNCIYYTICGIKITKLKLNLHNDKSPYFFDTTTNFHCPTLGIYLPELRIVT